MSSDMKKVLSTKRTVLPHWNLHTQSWLQGKGSESSLIFIPTPSTQQEPFVCVSSLKRVKTPWIFVPWGAPCSLSPEDLKEAAGKHAILGSQPVLQHREEVASKSLGFHNTCRKWAYAAQKQPWSLFCRLWDPYRCSGWDPAYPEHLLCLELSLCYFRVPDRLWSQGVRLLRPGLVEECLLSGAYRLGMLDGGRFGITSMVAFTSWVYSRNADGLWS